MKPETTDHTGKNDRRERVEELLQRVFDNVAGEDDAAELLRLWNDDPALKTLARENDYVERIFRFLHDSRTSLTPVRLDELKDALRRHLGMPPSEHRAAGSFFDGEMADVFRIEADDMDALARQAAEAGIETQRRKTASSAKHSDPPHAGQPSFPKALLISVSMLLLFFGVLVYQEWAPGPEPAADQPSAPNTPAVVVNMSDVRWHQDVKPPKLGESLMPGTLKFDAGSVELLSFKGVRSVIEGPAELILLNDHQVFCKRGRWSVTVPPSGRGYEIQTSALTIRDLGTEFYAEVEPEQCDLHVLKGEVEMERPNGTKTLFRTGRGALFRRDRPVQRIDAEPERFVSGEEMRRRGDASLFRGGMPDAATVRTLKAGAIRTIDFHRGSGADATLFGGEIVDTETPGSKAFAFTGPEGRIRMRPAGELGSFSVFVRLRMNRLNSERNPVLMSAGSRKNGLVWHIPSNGKMLVGVRYQSARTVGIFQTPVVFTEEHLGRTVDLALVVDGAKQSMTVYFEGDPVLTARLPRPTKWNLNELDVGSWLVADDSIRQIDGRVERLLLFDRVLNLEEIRLLER